MAKNNTVQFLEEVLKGTFVTISEGEIYAHELVLRNMREPGGLGQMKNYWKGELKRTQGHPYAEVAKEALQNLEDPDHVRHREEELAGERAKYEEQKAEWKKFRRKHRGAIDYVASLAQDSRLPTKLPHEELVFATLKRLSDITIMSETGFGAETMDATLNLYALVITAAERHASLTGQAPEAYCSKISSGLGSIDKVVTL